MKTLNRSIKHITITPNPQGESKTDYLDGSWLNLRFDGLLLPKIQDLVIECPQPIEGLYLDKTITHIDVERIDGQWFWVLTLKSQTLPS